MNKRILATFLWFNVGWTAGAMSTFFLGLPAGLDVALAATLAAVVWFDPIHLLWGTGRKTSTIRRREERLATPTLATE
jgi:hypothetical protein